MIASECDEDFWEGKKGAFIRLWSRLVTRPLDSARSSSPLAMTMLSLRSPLHLPLSIFEVSLSINGQLGCTHELRKPDSMWISMKFTPMGATMV